MTRDTIEEFTTNLSRSVRYSAGLGQYDTLPDCQNAYLDGVNTAIAMMYIDLTGSPKSEGMLAKFHHQELQKAREQRDKEVVKAIDKALITKTKYAEQARGWGAEGSDRYLGYIDGAMNVNGRVFWELAGIGIAPNLGIAKNQSELDQHTLSANTDGHEQK
jgi:hypothetical protein